MIEDVIDYNGTNGVYKQQPPLRPPPMNAVLPVQASVSPRFDSIMTKSNSVPWSPAPLDKIQHDKTLVDPLSTNPAYTKSYDVWPNNNTLRNSSERWSPNNTYTKPTDSSIVSNHNSSNAQMIKSSNKTFGFITDQCSPRCKLCIFGFVIGVLIVCIPLAVVLVLWLN